MSETVSAPSPSEAKPVHIPGVPESAPPIGEAPDFTPAEDDGRSALERLRAKITAEVEGKEPPKTDRDEKGRFVKADEQATPPAEGPKTPAEAQGLPDEVRALTPESFFEFAGEKFKDQKEAEEKYKTVRGMIKAADRRAKDALQTIGQYEQYLQSLQQSQPPQEQTPAEPTGFVESMGEEGWKTYESIRTEKGEAFANAWLSDRIEKHFKETLDSRIQALEESLTNKYPYLDQYQSQMETIQGVSELWGEFQGLTDDDGQPVFPELHEKDPQKLQQTVKEIGSIWQEYVRRAPQTIRDPYWMHVAINQWRTMKANESGSGGGDNTDQLLAKARQRDTGVVDQGAPVRQTNITDPRVSAQKAFEKTFTTSTPKKDWGFEP